MTRLLTLISIVLTLTLFGCGDDSPSSPDANGAQLGNSQLSVGAQLAQAQPGGPLTLSPVVGEHIASLQPLLTVENGTIGSPPRLYRFELANDSAMTDILIFETDVMEGIEGTTSWQVSMPLTVGNKYYWRAQATSGQTSAYSNVSEFIVREGFTTDRPGEVSVYDPLTNGSSVAMEVVGGRFTPQGWQAMTSSDYIRYQVPTTSEGYMEFDVTNIREPNPVAGKRMLISFWDPSKGNYRENPFRVHLQKMDMNTVNRWDVRLRWISRGQETNEGISFFDFEADVVYPWRIEWGTYPGHGTQQVRVFLEGVRILERNYDRPYRPNPFWIELGNQERAETLEEAIWSNVRIGTR